MEGEGLVLVCAVPAAIASADYSCRRAGEAPRSWALADSIGQSRAVQSVARGKDGSWHPTVSLDLLVRSLLALGASNRDLGQIIGRG